MNEPDDVPILEIENLGLSYFVRAGEIPAVIDFSLKVYPGESVGLVGESGCGKSTVANGIMRYMGTNGDIVAGRIKFKGRDMAEMSEDEIRRLRGKDIAMIYQEPMAALNPSLTVASQLMEVPIYHENISETEARQRAIEMLDAVHIPDPERVMAAYPHQISGGQQQRVVIAMALLSKPSLLLLDEPTTALDVTVEAGIVKLIKEIAERFNTAQIYISHNLGLIRETCSRVCVMYSGEIVEEAEIGKLFHEPRHPYTHGLFGCIALPSSDKTARPLQSIPGQLPLPHERPEGCNFGPRCAHFDAAKCGGGMIALDTVEAVPPGHTGHTVRCSHWRDIDWSVIDAELHTREASEIGDVVLDVQEMQKYYELGDQSLSALISSSDVKYVKANETLDFSARKGETVAIVGESGCGKSTFAKVLMGLEQSTGGKVMFGDDDFGQMPVDQRTPEQLSALQMVFQNPNDTLNPSHTVGTQVGRVIKRFNLETDQAKVKARVMKLLDEVKLPRDFYDRRPRQLSGGQKQRVGIARAFAGNPRMVVADEPVSALDVSVQAAVTELLMDVQREHGTTLLFISHDLSVVRYLADRIVVMYLGRIMEQGRTVDIFAPPYHPYTEALLSAVPIADPDIEKREIVLEGNLPSALDPPKGCPFSTRCPHHLGEICDNHMPPEHDFGNGHRVACHLDLDALEGMEPVFSVAGE
jgi:peptide/nickel transport system ATP-binding protein